MDVKDIQNLIKFVSKAEVAEVNLKTKDFEIKIKTTASVAPVVSVAQQPVVMQAQPQQVVSQPAVTSAPQASQAKEEDNPNYITVKSPMIGTFYRSPSPDKPVFVSVGDSVKAGSVLCIVEAMKLFNEIESEVSGKIVKILVDNATPIEFDQPLFVIDPS